MDGLLPQKFYCIVAKITLLLAAKIMQGSKGVKYFTLKIVKTSLPLISAQDCRLFTGNEVEVPRASFLKLF